MDQDLEAFVARWAASGAAERANKDSFLSELRDVLGVARPNPTTNDLERDAYVFERKVPLVHEDIPFLIKPLRGGAAGALLVPSAAAMSPEREKPGPSSAIALKKSRSRGVRRSKGTRKKPSSRLWTALTVA